MPNHNPGRAPSVGGRGSDISEASPPSVRNGSTNVSNPRSFAAIVAAALAAGPAAGQLPEGGIGPEQKTIVAGARYRKSGLYRFLFGADYRDLWTTPISLPVLDPQGFAG